MHYLIHYRSNDGSNCELTVGCGYDEAKRVAQLIARETGEPTEILMSDGHMLVAVWNSRDAWLA